MVTIVFSPWWFYGIDSLLDVVSLVVCLFVFLYAFKVYKLTAQDRYKVFSAAFLLFTMSFLVKILTNLAIYYKIIARTEVTVLFRSLDIAFIYAVGHLFYRLIFLIALVGLFYLILKVKNRRILLLTLFFAGVTSFYSYSSFYVFHIVAAVLLAFIFHHLVCNYFSKRSLNSLLVTMGFMLLFISQVLFIFIVYERAIYVLGEVFQLFGFLFLLFNLVLVRK